MTIQETSSKRLPMRQGGLTGYREKNLQLSNCCKNSKETELLNEFMILLVLKVLNQIKHLPGVVLLERELK